MNETKQANGAPAVLDIARVLADPHLDLQISTSETPLELQSRLRREEADAAAERRMDWLAFLAALFGIFLAAAICVFLYSTSTIVEDKATAKTVLLGLFSGSIGFVLGRSRKK